MKCVNQLIIRSVEYVVSEQFKIAQINGYFLSISNSSKLNDVFGCLYGKEPPYEKSLFHNVVHFESELDML